MVKKDSVLQTIRRSTLITLGAFFMAVNINSLVHAGGLIPGGFTGLTLLIQEICSKFFGFHIPFSIVLYILNSVPAIFCFKYVGKKFALYSIVMVILTGIFTDLMPPIFIEFLRLQDNNLLPAIFGGLLNAFSISLCLFAGATSGGTDFIAIYLSEKYRKDAWNYIFAGNCVILVIAGGLFSLDKALYSIIFQFVTTMALGTLYKAYQQKTLLIITQKPHEVFELISQMTHHGATSFKGEGLYNMTERVLLYSVVYANEVKTLVDAIHKLDADAFINVIKTEHLNGRFFVHPRD